MYSNFLLAYGTRLNLQSRKFTAACRSLYRESECCLAASSAQRNPTFHISVSSVYSLKRMLSLYQEDLTATGVLSSLHSCLLGLESC